MNVPAHLNGVATLPCEIKKRVCERKTLQTKIAVNNLYDATLCYTRLSGYLAF